MIRQSFFSLLKLIKCFFFFRWIMKSVSSLNFQCILFFFFFSDNLWLCCWHSRLNSSNSMTIPTLSCLFSYSFSANLLQSLIKDFTVLLLSPLTQYLLFLCIFFIYSLWTSFFWYNLLWLVTRDTVYCHLFMHVLDCWSCTSSAS